MPTSKYIKAKPGPRHSVIYIDENGRCERYEQGSWAWRNHNPGNLVAGSTSKRYGQIGKAGGFAVFPDAELGHQALLYCLSVVYKNKSVDDMVQKYAPPETNNTAAYRKFLYQKTGVTKGKKN